MLSDYNAFYSFSIDGNVFLVLLCHCKVSFIDGAVQGGAFTCEDPMFRCKTLLHTTGTGPRTTGEGGWEQGQFRCEARPMADVVLAVRL